MATYNASSRYFRGNVVKVTTSRGDQQVLFPPLPPARSVRGQAQVRVGMTEDLIAWRLYQDTKQWWRVAFVNEHIPFPLDLKPGDMIWVPA